MHCNHLERCQPILAQALHGRESPFLRVMVYCLLGRCPMIDKTYNYVVHSNVCASVQSLSSLSRVTRVLAKSIQYTRYSRDSE
jgi:hypothetical protein